MSVAEKLLALTRQNYPKGRAFKMPAEGFIERLHRALSVSEQQVYEDALSVLNNILPDNTGFTADDATAWERRLGLITNEDVSLADRKLAIIRKINHPGTIKSRQSALYLEGQLRAAGFNVYVYENRFLETVLGDELTTDPDFTSNGQWLDGNGDIVTFNTGSVDIGTLPGAELSSLDILEVGKSYRVVITADVGGIQLRAGEASPIFTAFSPGTYTVNFTKTTATGFAVLLDMGSSVVSHFSVKETLLEYVTKTPEELSGGVFLGFLEHGEIEHGEEEAGVYNNLIVNHIDEDREIGFQVESLRGTFFVGGDPVGSYANVFEERKNEFRQLILKLKPAQSVGFLFINYV
jgi:uncharacterized protein YmfQ (DUF2313 family)